MSKLSAYWKLYPGDLLRDTMHLTRAMFGSYILLMLAYRAKQGPLIDDDEVLMTIARCTPAEWQATREVLAPLFQVRGGRWHHKRLEADLLKDAAEYDARKQGADMTNARRGAQRARSGAQSESESHSESEPKAESKALTKCVVNALADGVEEELLRRSRDIVGDKVMNAKGGLLRTLMRDHVAAYRDALADMENRIKEAHLPEQKIKKTRIACFVDTFKRCKEGYRNAR